MRRRADYGGTPTTVARTAAAGSVGPARAPVPRTPLPNEDVMPKSKVRKKPVASTAGGGSTTARATVAGPSHPFYVAVMLGLMLLGLAWLVVNYLAGDRIAFFTDLGAWNFLIGFALMIAGLLMTMRWR